MSVGSVEANDGGALAGPLRAVMALVGLIVVPTIALATLNRGDGTYVGLALGASLGLGVYAGVRLRRKGQIEIIDLFVAIAIVQTGLLPMLENAFGTVDVPFRTEVRASAANAALAVTAAFVVLVLLGHSLIKLYDAPSQSMSRRRLTIPALALVAAGCVGLAIRWPEALANVRRGAISASTAPVGISDVFATFATHLLPVGAFFLVWGSRSLGPKLLLAVLFAPLSILALSSYSLNRAAIIFPIVAMLMTLERYSKARVKPLHAAAIAVLLVAIFFAVGLERSERQVQAAGLTTQPMPLFDFIAQSAAVYLQSPHLSGVVFSSPRGDYSPDSLLSSALSPVPILGQSFRDQSGVTIYNDQIYGFGNWSDQILPLPLEVYGSTGGVGLVVFGLLLGVAVAVVSRTQQASSNPVKHYALSLVGIWLAQLTIVSVAILSQILVYFIAPLLLVVIALKEPARPSGIGDDSR